jgi:hypothetical protein
VKVPFTPGSVFSGYTYQGTATLLVLAAITVPLAFRGLSRIELDMVRSLVRTTSADVKSPTSYAGRTPIGAIYSMNLSTMSLAGRMNMGGSARYISRRVRTRWVALGASAAATAYFLFVLYTGQATLSTDTAARPGQLVVAIILSFFTFGISQSAITNERIWLSLTSLPAASYFRHLVAARTLSVLVILAPFVVANAVLSIMGFGGTLPALIVIGTVIPSTFVLEVCWAAYIAPIQVKGEDMTMPAQFSMKQLSTAIPLVAVILLVSISSISLIAGAVGGVLLCALAAALAMSGRFWSGVLTRLTENGFI